MALSGNLAVHYAKQSGAHTCMNRYSGALNLLHLIVCHTDETSILCHSCSTLITQMLDIVPKLKIDG